MNKSSSLVLLVAVLAAGQHAAVADDKHMGVATCAASQCHGSAVPRDSTGVLQNEYVTWTQDDPHSGAYEALSSDASRAMAARLGLKSAQSARICLDCHADNIAVAERGERFQLSDGVGCEACHGGSENWLSSHYDTPAVSHQDNLQSGMTATDNAAVRAELCLSCHLGTASKFATHRIMAAGHPRLAFELDTFTELWRTAGRQPHYRVDADYRERKNVLSHIEIWAAGLFADARRRLALLQDPRFAGSGMFPELGLYDCHACHRSMKSVQWRRLERHANADPGTPFVSDGSFVMLLALARSLAPAQADSVADALAALHVSGGQSVADIRAAALTLDEKFSSLQVSAGEQTLRRNGDAILVEILELGAAGEYLDYASAEQAFMAVQMLAYELDLPSLQSEIDTLATALDDDELYRPAQFARLLGGLESLE